MSQEDPGWWPSLRGLWRHWIALVGSVMRFRARPVEANGLILLRSVFLVLVGALLLFVVPLSFIGPWDGGDERWVPWAVIAIGTISLAWVARIRRRPSLRLRRRPLPVITEHCSSSGSVPPRTQPCWGSLAFLGGSLWIYLVGLAFGLVGLWMIAPTRSDIERRQREITAAGSPLSLLDALISVPWPYRGHGGPGLWHVAS